MKQPWILGGARTAFTTWHKGKNGKGDPGGALKPKDPFDLGAAALKGAWEKSGIKPEALDSVMFGNAYHVGPHACYGGRYVAHRAGLADTITGLTVNLACGAGLYAVIATAERISTGAARCVGTVGADCSSLIPRNVFVPSFNDASCGKAIGRTAEALGEEFGITREEMDRWSLLSHQRAAAAKERGVFAEEIVPLPEASEDDNIIVGDQESTIKASELLFEDGGITATPANTHGIVDGGAALIISEEKIAGGAKPLGRYLAGAVVAIAPERMAFASVPAIRTALKNADLTTEDIDLFEVNETFASQVLVDLKELGIPEDKVNVNGGAIALGHPFGATGPRQILTLLKELERRDLRRGIASICVGGGQGVAVVVERA